MKYLFLILLPLAVFSSCNQVSDHSGKVKSDPDMLHFKFSNEPALMDVRDPNNWCSAKFQEAALVSADPKNFYRRLFALGDIPLRVIIDLGHQSAAFILLKKGHQIDIYTSDNFPACLSNKQSFQISPDGSSFRYDNKRGVSCDLYLQALPNGVQIALDLPSGGDHGLSVLRCDACK